jgi:hypothetical protein
MRIRPLMVVLATGAVSAGCTSERLVTPSSSASAVSAVGGNAASAQAAETDETPVVSSFLAELDAQLEAAGSNMRVAKAELIVEPEGWTGSSQVLIANNRTRGLSSEWVAGDPRRAGRVGVTYAFDPRQGFAPFTRNPDGSGLRQVQFPELEPFLEEAMSAWRDRSCSSAPIARVAVPTNVDPDQVDQALLGSDGGRPYAQVSDIVHGGWQPAVFFPRLVNSPSGNNIIGVTITFVFVDANGRPTDIDGNGKLDTGLAEIYYNTRFAWGNSQALNVVDFFSIITHETGHGVSLAHFGKVFVTKHDAADGIQIADIKFAPEALMNAVYVTGRSQIAGTDNSSFCQIWASKK